MPSLQKFWKILCKNNALSWQMFTCFKMHPVNKRRRPLPLPLSPPLVHIHNARIWGGQYPRLGKIKGCLGADLVQQDGLEALFTCSYRRTV